MGKATWRLGLQDPLVSQKIISLKTYFTIIITLKYYQYFTYFPSFSYWGYGNKTTYVGITILNRQ